MNQSIKCLLMEEKKEELKYQKIQTHSLIIHKELMIFMKIYNPTNEKKSVNSVWWYDTGFYPSTFSDLHFS